MNINCGHCKGTHTSVSAVRECATQQQTPEEAPYETNPWMDLHLDAELAYTGGGYTRKMARAAVIQEFEGHHEALTCGHCNKLSAFFRPTVGAVMCFGCHSIRVGRVNQETKEVTTIWTDPR